MKTSQWRRAVENRCISSARLKVLSNRSGDPVVLVADGFMWLVHWLQNFTVQLQSGHMEPVEYQSLQIAAKRLWLKYISLFQ